MDKLSYALGLNVGYSYLASGINKLQVEDFAEGVRAVMEAKEPAISIDEAKQIINEFLTQLQAEADKAAEANLKAGEAFLAE
ncbi:MAG: FKBP-type peptidyl-prolyl cis-trans isomerase N-terminal domain-containing protein, partial [Bacteroidaceae bacterium]|nr:FKBP-type peptidyl-prolyl cis-trans isomerase N-terminal domain-containing protein [Bacteroidaceae bacterium]